MGERALSWGLRLLGIALMVGPILAALAVYGVSLDLITPEPNLVEALGELGGMMENSDVMVIRDDQISITENQSVEIPFVGTFDIPQKVEIPVEFTSPLDYVILRFESFSGDIYCDYDNAKIGSMTLKEPVEAKPHIQCSFTLVVDLSDALAHYPTCSNINALITDITNGKLKITIQNPSLTIYELTITMPGQLGETLEFAF